MEVFSARLKWLRESKGFSQQEMADMLDLSQSYYGRFERNKGEPNLETLAKISSILKESVDFLLGLEELTIEAKELLERSLELAESIKSTNDSVIRMFENNMSAAIESLDPRLQKALLKNYQKDLSLYKAKYKKAATEFALMVVKIPFSKFYGEGLIDDEGNILYNPEIDKDNILHESEKIVDEYLELD
ncbi:helix-turn-helix domain-containing protein [Paenibacillus polymyxa]|uniref:helix-turn-helix domain-containing protein n=1 Tax=Paenibacillus polymyxa TaxID=1406 RepID=UPI000845F9FF|nr:transcriptional regulator [Paenibacillus polymyxa]AOK88511.1 hypothetical protein AOU00_01185 [Paenibacillus polymyxa]